MNSQTSHSNEPIEYATDELLDAVVVYEESSAARRALSTLRHLTSGLGETSAFRPHLRRFDVLTSSSLTEDDMGELDAPKLVFICSEGNQPLPERIKAWLSGVLAKNTHLLVAVVALIGDGKNSIFAAQDIEFIERLAVESGFHFFSPQSILEAVPA